MKVEIGNSIGDSNPEKVEEVGDYTLKVKDPAANHTVLTSKDVTLKLGASYEFLVQWNDEANVIEASSAQLITVSVCNVFKECKKYMKNIINRIEEHAIPYLFNFSEYHCI